jgi:hypothetical protein
MISYFYNVKKYLSFDKQEIKHLLAIILVFTLVLGYNDGYESFEFGRWIFNLLSSLMIATSVVVAKELGHKLVAIKFGYTVRLKVWWPILLLNGAFIFVTNGAWHILLPVSGLFILHHEKLRIGHFRYGHNYVDNAIIGFAGPLFNVYLAIFFKMFSSLANPNIAIAVQANLLYAVVNMIPLDIIFFFVQRRRDLEHADIRKHPAPFAGTYMFYSTRIFYIFGVSAIAILAALSFVSGVLASTITAFVIAAIIFLVIWWQHEFTLV